MNSLNSFVFRPYESGSCHVLKRPSIRLDRDYPNWAPLCKGDRRLAKQP